MIRYRWWQGEDLQGLSYPLPLSEERWDLREHESARVQQPRPLVLAELQLRLRMHF